MVSLPESVDRAGYRLEVGWVHASPMATVVTAWTVGVVGVAAVVELHPFGDRPDVGLVRPSVGHVDGLAGARTKVSVAISGAVGAGPEPAAVRSLGDEAHEPRHFDS